MALSLHKQKDQTWPAFNFYENNWHMEMNWTYWPFLLFLINMQNNTEKEKKTI